MMLKGRHGVNLPSRSAGRHFPLMLARDDALPTSSPWSCVNSVHRQGNHVGEDTLAGCR